jgi:hypothetical protein
VEIERQIARVETERDIYMKRKRLRQVDKERERERESVCVWVVVGEITHRGANLNVATRQKKMEVRERKRCTHRDREGEIKREREWRQKDR